MEFFTRPRLAWHLQHSKPGCLLACREHLKPLTAEEAEALDKEDRVAARALRKDAQGRGPRPLRRQARPP
eukprot:2186100-Lingulodinium_polyedra.AAC.1